MRHTVHAGREQVGDRRQPREGVDDARLGGCPRGEQQQRADVSAPAAAHGEQAPSFFFALRGRLSPSRSADRDSEALATRIRTSSSWHRAGPLGGQQRLGE